MWLLLKTRDKMIAIIFLVSMVSFSSSAVQRTKVNTRVIRQATAQTPETCVCVPYYFCNSDNMIITNGQGLIDIRQARSHTRLDTESETMCDDYLEVCCGLPAPVSDDSPKCGLRRENRLPNFIPRLDKEEADQGEFPWIVTIFRTKTVQRNNETKEIKVYQCQGSLISERVVLTAAQCIKQHRGSGNTSESLSIRAGQLDTMMTNEESEYQERDVETTIFHKKYDAIKLRKNAALLILKTPVTINKYVDITCLADRSDVIEEDKCVVVGWDKYLGPEDAPSQRSQVNPLKKRSVPYVNTKACQGHLRKTLLGKEFKLDNSSICAGSSTSKAICSAEVGGPLSCPLKNEPSRYVQVGIASWCMNFGNSPTPSVFASVVNLRGWIDTQITKLRLDTSVYRATRQ